MGAERLHDAAPANNSTTSSGAASASGAQTCSEIRILFIEDVSIEAELALHHLRKGGIVCSWLRVDSEEALRNACAAFRPSVILSDFTLPRFDGLSALAIARQLCPDVPFLFVSGTIGEERAIEALRQGAVDYVLKTNLARLAPAVKRALEQAEVRLEQRRQQAQIARLTRVLRMLSGINGVMLRIRDRDELLSEACRVAVSIGGYATAIVLLKQSTGPGIQPVAGAGRNTEATNVLRATLAESGQREGSIVGKVLRSARPFVCNDTAALAGGNVPVGDAQADTDLAHGSTTTSIDSSAVMALAGFRSLVALPLLIDKTALGVLMLTATDAGTVSNEELQMLREVAANLSFALQYLQKDSAVRLLSHFDAHTGLAKRSLFCERLTRLLARGGNRHTRRAVAVFDIEQLSVINDSFGRHIGDLLLQHVTDRLRRHFHDTELLAQLGGGTFALALELVATAGSEGGARSGAATPSASTSGADGMRVLEEHLAAVFGPPFELEGASVPIVAKVGLAMHPDNGQNAPALVQNAEAALRAARASGQRTLLYSVEQHSGAKARLALEHKLRAALALGQFELHYQSKVSVKNRIIDGAEALIRWNDPDSGLVSPAAFLPVLESTGLIVEVGEWVIEQAARDCAHWHSLGLPAVRVAVNVAPLQLSRADFGQRFPQGLDIEITEGALFEDNAALLKKLKQLRALGVRVAIDDFGTGYSSLSRLSELPIDTLKIDRTFVARLPGDRSGRTLVSTIISLAHAFGMTTVAEGVETPDQLGALWQMGCDQAQGFLLSRPVPRDEFAKLLDQTKRRIGK